MDCPTCDNTVCFFLSSICHQGTFVQSIRSCSESLRDKNMWIYTICTAGKVHCVESDLPALSYIWTAIETQSIFQHWNVCFTLLRLLYTLLMKLPAKHFSQMKNWSLLWCGNCNMFCNLFDPSCFFNQNLQKLLYQIEFAGWLLEKHKYTDNISPF